MICLNAKGEMCIADDPERMIWFGDCGYWTDDFSLLSVNELKNPPYRCPKCGDVLYRHPASIQEYGRKLWDRDHPGYEKWHNDNKEVCFGAEYDNVLFIKGFLDLEMKEQT